MEWGAHICCVGALAEIATPGNTLMIKYLAAGAASLALLAGAPALADESRLAAALTAQPDETKARYDARNPKETLTFFGVEPGMTVVEALPGGGWYSKILLPYLGHDGELIGADYSMEMWPLFGGFATPEFIEKRKTWVTDAVEAAQEWRGEHGAKASAFVFGSLPEEMKGAADVVLFIRALHNLARFNEQGGFFDEALADAYAALKPGGVVGVVQHRAPETNSDEWASGENGYLKQAWVIEQFEAAGFEFVDASEVNANPKDQPTEEDIVWRLPPSLGTSKDNPELMAQMKEIGESDRMTLMFRKPQ